MLRILFRNFTVFISYEWRDVPKKLLLKEQSLLDLYKYRFLSRLENSKNTGKHSKKHSESVIKANRIRIKESDSDCGVI